METLPLFDQARERSLATTLHLPPHADGPHPLIIFGHGFTGHPRRFTKLLGAWAEAGYAVAAPAFPLTNGDADQVVFDDVVNQPADVRFVIDELLAGPFEVDPARIGVAGFSLGAATSLAVGFNPAHRDPRPRAIAMLSGGFFDSLGGPHAMDAKPLLVVHGTDDGIVPYELGEAVYGAAQPPKVLITLEGGHHREETVDVEGPLPAVVETTLAFWDLFLRDDDTARARLLADRPGAIVTSAGL